ncbi:Ig-like domain-containing protein [Bradyrhizobium yuanmingense]|uniref:Ig-like domain-containing protein n=1 Tax=Bradyrhizobium yuanmingense TaxID=108015 RepID=UPI0023B91741|nr:Ig-like domain-containing protein [Bradyrhizobium yuanmingense]MDF0494641.1 Ig-like domain-containing protein [Bradyrhizobium yuanmingense]
MISGLDIHGSVFINAPNVTLENCKVTTDAFYAVRVAPGVTGAVIQHNEINGVGTGNDGDYGIMGQGTFIANNIYNVENGIGVDGGNTLIQDNYIHDMIASGSPHYDGISIDGKNYDITIRHNTVINDHTQTAAIMIDNYFGPVSNVVVDNNLLYGGGYNIYSSAQFNGGSVTGVSITNNHMGGGYWGPTAFTGNTPVYTGNVEDSATLISILNTSANSGTSSGSTGTAAPVAPVIASFSTDSGTAGDKITNDNTIELKGSAAAGSTVKVYDGTTQIGSTTADSSGHWDYITKVLTDAKHTLTATATNSSGQTSTASSALAITVDTTAPTAPTIVSQTVNSANQVVMSGKAEASSVVKLFDGTTQIGTVTADSSGVWGYTTGTLAAGSHSLTAKATDVAGNTSVASTAVTASTGTSTLPTTPTSPTAGTVIESAGATRLVESGDKFYLNSSTGTGPTLKYGGVDFIDGSDGTWAPIAAEKTATGYQVAWKEASTGQYTAWNTDSNGNYLSHVSTLTGFTWGGSVSGTDSGLKSLETSFQQDLNKDGQIGTSTATTPTSPAPTAGTVIESAGATRLVESGDKFYLNTSTATGPTLKYGGVAFVDGSDGTWAPIAAEKTATGYQVAWKEASTGQYTAWNTDSNGNYLSHVSTLTGSTWGGSVSGTDSGLKSLETSFQQDLNKDGQIGTSTATTPTSPAPTSPTPTAGTVIESAGATRLVESGDKFYLNTSTGTGPTLKYGGVDFIDGSDGTWAPIAAEKTATGYQVAWKEASTGQYTAWNTDSNGNYLSHVSTLTGFTWGGSVSGTDSGLKSLETSFQQDLNKDGQIGSSTASLSSQVVATSGSTFIASTGDTTLKGTSGDDTFVGSSQADTFVFGANFGNDVIKGFVARGPAHDTIEFSKSVFDSFASVLSHAAQSGGDVVIATGSDTLTLKNTKLDSLTSHDFHFA